MKVPCPLCGDKVPRKRLVIIKGLYVERRIAKACEKCFSMSDRQHREKYEQENGESEIKRTGD